MTTDPLSTAANDSTHPPTMESIQEEQDDAATVNGDDMDEEDPELAENSNCPKTHVIMRFDGNGAHTNVAFLVKEVFVWLQEIHPDLYIGTSHPKWTAIKSSDQFPTKEADFIKCFSPTGIGFRGGNGSVSIGFFLFCRTPIEQIKQRNKSFVQYLQSKKIGLKTSCGGTVHETTICALLGFNTDRAHRASLLQQLVDQLIHVLPDSAESRLLEKAKQLLPFPGIIPPFQLHTRWINASARKYQTKTFTIVCDAAHADFLRSILLRSYLEKRILGIGKVFQLGTRNAEHLPRAITWNNNFLDGSSVLTLVNISRAAMDHPFDRKITVSNTESTTIRRLLLSDGKATNITESRDISLGRWIVAIDKDKVETLTHLVAGTISKLYENGLIPPDCHFDDQQPPKIDNQRMPRRSSLDSALSNDEKSVQSMMSNAWGELPSDDTGSISKKIAGSQTKKIQFIFDPSTTSEFPPLPTERTPSQRPDTSSSVGSTNSITKQELDQFQTKLNKDLAAHLQQCRSTASSVTEDSSRSFFEELKAERIEADQRNAAAQAQSDRRFEQMMQANQSMMASMQQMIQGLLPMQFNGPPPNFDPHLAHQQQLQQQQHHMQQMQQQHQQQQQQMHQQQQQPPPPPQQHQASQQASQHVQPPPAPHQPQPAQQPAISSPARDDTQQHQHFNPQQRPPPKTFTRPGNLFDLQRQSHAPPPPPIRPPNIPPGTIWWDPYNKCLRYQQPQHHPNQQPPQPPPLLPHQLRYFQEEEIQFDYGSQYSQRHQDEPKSTPGGTGPTYETPDKKRGKKPAGSNATQEFYANQPMTDNDPPNSTSDGAGGAQ